MLGCILVMRVTQTNLQRLDNRKGPVERYQQRILADEDSKEPPVRTNVPGHVPVFSSIEGTFGAFEGLNEHLSYKLSFLTTPHSKLIVACEHLSFKD